MGHKISKEQIDPGVKDHIMSFVGDIADLETEVNTDIISAINSMMVDRVDNAENMGKLANAIGEPVTANHSVDEVVEGLGEMLSTFKTNMMNSGVMVESGDKFKALIDKIKGLTEGEGNKGIQFAEGLYGDVVNLQHTSSYPGFIQTVTIQTNTGFIPNIICLQVISSTRATTYFTQENNLFLISTDSYNNETGAKIAIPVNNGYAPTIDVLFVSAYINNITENTFELVLDTSTTIGYDVSYDLSIGKWYAIGVGEEDTTLRDSLASILQEEGISVTEEDDMASLITKVDEGFDITKQELINALIDKGVKNIDTTLSLTEIISKIQNFDSYTEPILYLYDNGNDFTDNTGGFTFNRTSGSGSGVANEDHLYVHVYTYPPDSGSSIGSAYCETTNFINITNYKSLYVNLDYNYSRSGGSMGAGSFYIDLIDESDNILKTVASGQYSHVGYEGKIDIVNYAGNVKIRFRTTVTAITTRSDSKLMVYHARLEKAELPTEE